MIELKRFYLKGVIDVPSSKSYAHRVLIMSFLTKTKLVVNDVDFSDDINYTLDALIKMGAIVEKGVNSVRFVDYKNCPNELILNVGMSASTLRFLIPVALSLAERVVFKGDKSLFKRPLNTYYPIFDSSNIDYQLKEDELVLKGKLNIDSIKMDAAISSQFVTGMLFYLCINNKASLIIQDKIVSSSYIDMTKDVMNMFGVKAIYVNGAYHVLKEDNCLEKISIEKDYSQLAFWSVLGVLNGEIKTKSFNKNSLQGDKVIIKILKELNANICDEEDYYIFKKSVINKDIVIDLQECIDLGPILFVLATFNMGVTTFLNVDRLKIKESDRLNSMKCELEKIGVHFKVIGSKVVIKGKEKYKGDYVFDSHGDHRVAMSLMVLACLIDGRSVVRGTDCISKSYPKFINHLFSLKI